MGQLYEINGRQEQIGFFVCAFYVSINDVYGLHVLNTKTLDMCWAPDELNIRTLDISWAPDGLKIRTLEH